MKKYICIIALMITPVLFFGCESDDEVILITDNEACYISALQLYASDNRNAVVGTVVIDNDKNTIQATVKNGSNLARLKPRCSLAPEATLSPKMGVWTDFSSPAQYTVTSGNGQIKKTYAITVIEQQ